MLTSIPESRAIENYLAIGILSFFGPVPMTISLKTFAPIVAAIAL